MHHKGIIRPAILTLIALTVLSCAKDPFAALRNQSDIVMGDLGNMDIQILDTVLIGDYNRGAKYFIDLDGDNTDDIAFESVLWGSPGMGVHPKSSVLCLHENIRLSSYLKTDTTFLNISTRSSTGNDGITEIHEYQTISAIPLDEADSIINIENDVFKIGVYERGEIILTEDLYKSHTMTLVDDAYGSIPDVDQINQDTIKYTVRTYYNNFSFFPEDEIVYIGVKLTNENKSKLGWIKISVSNKMKIFILEAALRKNWNK